MHKILSVLVASALTVGCNVAPAGRPAAPASLTPTPDSVSTADVDRFWSAYDAVLATQDRAERITIMQRMYVDRATTGLRALMAARDYTTETYVDAISNSPRFWTTIRPLTVRAANAAAPLRRDVEAFRRLYPELKPASITYAIGALRTNGTTMGNMVLIGAELALADETVDVSDLPEPLRSRLGTYFKSRPFEHSALLTIHEYVHTQQRDSADILAARVVYEGVAELVAERITGRKPPLDLYRYGPANAGTIKAQFVAEMDGASWGKWLYNSAKNEFGVSDLGYFVGYNIAKGYYDRAPDKAAAIRAMIELDYSDMTAVKRFIASSGYLNA